MKRVTSPYGMAARIYAARGLAVLPLRPLSKEPATSHGFHDATTNADAIDSTASALRRANIGVACAASGVVVIDRDDRNGGEETLDRLLDELGPMPATWTVCTPNGMHFYFRAAPGERFVGMLGPGVDVKHDGYVVAPPSTRPGGKVYTWEASSRFDEVELAELPASWRHALTARARRAALPSSGLDAKDSYLGAAFEEMGWLGPALPDGRRMVQCPWLCEHSDGRGGGSDSSTVIFPRAVDGTLGGFRCAHGHCSGRTWRDVLDVFPLHVRAAATRAMRVERNRIQLSKVSNVG